MYVFYGQSEATHISHDRVTRRHTIVLRHTCCMEALSQYLTWLQTGTLPSLKDRVNGNRYSMVSPKPPHIKSVLMPYDRVPSHMRHGGALTVLDVAPDWNSPAAEGQDEWKLLGEGHPWPIVALHVADDVT